MPEEHINPEAEAPQEAPEVPTEAQDTETFDREYVEKLRAENAKWRNKVREREEKEKEAAEAKRQAELSAEERAKEAERKAQEAEQTAQQRIRLAEIRADLAAAGKVSNPKRLLALMQAEGTFDDLVGDDALDVDAILEQYPEYAATPAGPTPTKGGGGSTKRAITEADLKDMSPTEINERWDEIQAALKRP